MSKTPAHKSSTKVTSARLRTKKTTRGTREETTQRILDAADELYAVRNPVSVTVREVAEKAGVTHALIHQYVGSKDDLLNAVIQRVAVNRLESVKKSSSLAAALELIVPQVLENRTHSKALVRSAMDGVEYVSLADRIETGQALIALAKQDAVAGTLPTPTPHDIDPEVLVAAVVALSFGWAAIEDWLWPLCDLDPADKDDVYAQLAKIVGHLTNLALTPRDDLGEM